jgi:hypothetical protein
MEEPIKEEVFWIIASALLSVPGKPGGFNRSTQHSSRTPLTLKTKAGIAR